MTKECKICGLDFVLEDKVNGGLAIHCDDCSEENTPKYAGVSGADGKQASISILKFKSESDRESYLDFFKNNSGLYKAKSCQIGRGLKQTPNIQFETVAVNLGNVNAKGKS